MLFVTLVILIILATITLNIVFNENGLIKKVSEAKLKTDIANWKEKLEMAKSPVLIEGLGKFDIDKYFDYIQEQGIINDIVKDVIDNKDGTYDVTTKPGYVFLITLMPSKENSRDAQIEYIGQVGKIAPIIKKLEASATENSINAKAIIARLGNGTAEYWYKISTEDDSEYKKMANTNGNEEASIMLTPVEGTTYKIKLIAKNEAGESVDYAELTIGIKVNIITLDREAVVLNPNDTIQLNATVLPENAENKKLEWSSSNEMVATVDENGLVTANENGDAIITVKAKDGSNQTATCAVTVKIPVESIELNKTEAFVRTNETITLKATVNPENATNKNVTWKSSNTAKATVTQDGVVTGVTEGTVTITATSDDDATISASCTVTVSTESDWALIAKIAKEIAEGRGLNENNREVTSSSARATVSVDGNSETIRVGQEFYVKHNKILKKVRVLGFNHDTLTNPTAAYGSETTATTAGISFEFADFFIGTRKQMNSDRTQMGGWAKTEMRTYLEGLTGVKKISEPCKSNIKQVNKKYIQYIDYTNRTGIIAESADKLWLLSFSEIFTNTSSYDYRGPEGQRYMYYSGTSDPKSLDKKYQRLDSEGKPAGIWLRSLASMSNTYESYHMLNSQINRYSADYYYYVAPGFSI